MKITIYELLGLVKNGKAPKKIKYDGDIYILESDAIYEFFTYKTIDYDKFNTDGKRIGKALFLDNCYMHLYDEVEILNEAKEDKIQKIYHFKTSLIENEVEIFITKNLNQMVDKFNELIDEINNLKEKQWKWGWLNETTKH